MHLALVQLSDLHTRTGTEDFLQRVNLIVNAVMSLDPPELEVLLLWTGDLVFSGLESQLLIAAEFITALESSFARHPNATLIGSAFIPGNHDCDFRRVSDARAPLLLAMPSLLSTIAADGDIVRNVSAPQEEFFNFIDSQGIQTQNPLLWTMTFKTPRRSIVVRCCNTAWMSDLHEQAGHLLYPEQLVSPRSEDLVISLLHHPFPWFSPENGKALRRALEADSHLIFTGHEHEADLYTRIGRNATTQYIEGAALSADGTETGFNVVLLGDDTLRYDLKRFVWNDPLFVPAETVTATFTRTQRQSDQEFHRSANFESLLDEVTAPYSHPRKTQLRLPDLFVYPDLTRVRLDGPTSASQPADTISSEYVLEELAAQPLSLVSGPQGFGKSALARSICKGLLDRKGIIALFLEKGTLTSPDETKTAATIEQTFCQEYSQRLFESFRQLPKERKAVVIDDWDDLRLNTRGKIKVLSYLATKFGCIVLFDHSGAFAHSLEGLIESSSSIQPQLYDIAQFGYALRGTLVTLWHSLGRESQVSDEELAHDVSVSEQVLATLIGGGILPSTPLFLLSALQLQEEVQQKGSLYGSYGHIYQSLITSRLSRVTTKNIPLLITFLAALAWDMFRNQVVALSESQVRAVHQNYQHDYRYTVDRDAILKDLTSSGLIRREAGEVTFAYRYAYYFFVATALKNSVDDEEVEELAREKLSQLAKQAYIEDNANIIMFFLYLSKDRRLIREIIGNSQSIYPTAKMASLREDVDFVVAGPNGDRPISEPPREILSNLQQHRKSQDEADSSLSISSSQAESESSYPELSFAVKSIEIMGQVLRNFPTDLKGDLKRALVQETYALGFRLMGAYISMLRERSELIQSVLLKRFELDNSFLRKSQEKQSLIVRKALAYLLELGIYGMVKKLSSAVGSRELADTYLDVRQAASDDDIPMRLVDLSIRLDHFPQIPEADVIDLEKRLRSSFVAATTLRILVAQHLALFPVDVRQRQRLVALAKLTPSTGVGNKGRLVKPA